MVDLTISMSQATSWQQIFDTCKLLVKDRQFRRLSGQAACLSVFAILWWMNWKLFLATSVGIGAMSACYLFQNSHWQNTVRNGVNFLSVQIAS